MSINLRGRGFLKELDYTREELLHLVGLAGELKEARRAGAEEVNILRLVGVPGLRLAAPVVLPAIGLAALGSLLGLTALILASEPGGPWTGGWLRTVLGLDPLPLLPPSWLASLASGGAALGLIGALAAGRS